MALKPISTSTTYKISLEELKKDYAEQLGVTPDKISIAGDITRKDDGIFGGTSITFKGITVTVNQ